MKIFSNISNKYKHLIGNRFQDNDVVTKNMLKQLNNLMKELPHLLIN